jgi:N-carbamoyl-L-amino-acid hydrolase
MNLPETPLNLASTSAELAQDHINNDRLQQAIAALARFGGRADGGVARETLTAIDLASRRYLIEQARALGCEVSIDDCANLFFRRPGSNPALPSVLTGSHADTQPVGGKLDGAYGVLAGLEIIAALNDAGITTERPIDVVAWTNEEGSRFGPGAMGSSAYVESSRLAQYRTARDADGVFFGDALDNALAEVTDVPRRTMPQPHAACIELHIEQGPVLERAAIALGVVTGIQSVRWFTVTCTGTAAHAGTTPMDERGDAMAAAVGVAQQLYQQASRESVHQLRLTLGRWQVSPNSINTIPGRVTFSVDMRCGDEAVVERFEHTLRALLHNATWRGSMSVERIFMRPPTRFPESMLTLIEQGCTRAGNAAPLRLTSGAFHDAMYLAEHCPTAMIFVPSKNGISHNAAEATDPHDLFLGVQALAYAVTALASR